jgi:hypothetical protein
MHVSFVQVVSIHLWVHSCWIIFGLATSWWWITTTIVWFAIQLDSFLCLQRWISQLYSWPCSVRNTSSPYGVWNVGRKQELLECNGPHEIRIQFYSDNSFCVLIYAEASFCSNPYFPGWNWAAHGVTSHARSRDWLRPNKTMMPHRCCNWSNEC